MPDLSGRTAIVTGGATLLAHGVVGALVGAGARVVVADVDEAGGKAAEQLGPDVVFVRTDVSDRDNRVPAHGDAVCRTQLGTVIGNAAGVTVSTIEHLMAALAMLGIDNAVVELDEGPRMMSNIIDCPQTPEALELDMKLEVAFEKVDDKLTLPLFRPAKG